MDHISKALERAKSEQQTVRSWVRPDAPDTDSDVKPRLLDSGRVAELDFEVLHSHHVLCHPSMDDPVITDKYRLLRTRVLQLMTPRASNKLGITSPGPRAGKTLNAINLAVSIARDGNHHVYLVDADLRRPALAQTLGIDPDLGLIDYLSAGTPLGDIALSPKGLDHVTIIPGRDAGSGAEAPDFLRSRKMNRLLRELDDSKESTVIIVDLPPILIGDDVIAVAPLLDSMLLVVEEGGTDLEELKSTAELLAPFNLLGTVLNRSTERSKEAVGYYEAYHG